MDKILIFIIFLGPLVFFHELGHYFFARLFKVRVEVFSIGFGPKLFKFVKGGTEYAISLIPLGGYVKMFGDDPRKKGEIPESEREFSFIHKGKWARFWIVIGGPLANFILAYFIFLTLLASGERIPEIKAGIIPQGTELYKNGLRTGDVVRKVNSNEVFNPSDLALEGSTKFKTITVFRNGVPVILKPALKGKDFLEKLMKYPPFLRKPLVVNDKGERLILSLSKNNPDLSLSFDSMAELGGTKEFFILREIPKSKTYQVVEQVVLDTSKRESFLKALQRRGYLAIDLQVKSVKMSSPADKIGIQAGDVFFKLEGKEIFGFETLRSELQKTKSKTVSLELFRKGERKTISIEPEVKELGGKKVKLIGVYSAGEYIKLKFIHTKSKGVFASLAGAAHRTWDTTLKTFDGFKRLFTGDVSLKNIGGPLSIGKVASDSFNTSLSYFFQLMALISINLGIINLFPIPVLDGGHILFIFFEIVNRGPLSEKKMEIAQQVGLSLLMMLMVGAIFNDFSRFF